MYACQRFEHHLGTGDRAPRAGFFLGDGAGVGKGRTIAGLLLEQWRCGRHKAVWVSTSNDLVNDAKRWGGYCACMCIVHVCGIVHVRLFQTRCDYCGWIYAWSCCMQLGSQHTCTSFHVDRDLADIGASFIPVIPLNKLPYKSLSGKQLDIKRGVLFVTYATLTSESDRVRSG